jgi:glycosyltransferase involved in cell wall biosynthesis
VRIVEVEVFGRGGLTHYVYCLGTALANRGHEVCIVTAADYELQSRVPSFPDGLSIRPLFSRLSQRLKGRMPGRVLRALKGVEFFGDAVSVLRYVRRERPDIVHVHCTNQIALWLMWLLRCAGVPVVWTAHDVTPHESFRGERAVYGTIYGGSDLVIAHSERDRERLREEFEFADGRIAVIPHGDYQIFEAGTPVARDAARRTIDVADDAEVVLFFGFIREYKGLDVLFDAWPEVAAERPRARLVVVGDPARLSPARLEEYREHARALDVIDRFEYVPFEEVSTYLAASDMLVLPYRKISQSGVLMLAMAVGLPVVATRVGAFPEVIDSGRTGMLVSPGSVSELSSAIRTLLADPGLRSDISEASRRYARDTFSWDSIAARTIERFETLRARETV